jgi:iron complex outermembrane receptor protein
MLKVILRFYLFILFSFFISTSVLSAQEQQWGTIRGTITDKNGMAASDAEVSIVELRRRTKSDAEGSFQFAQVPAGRYVIEVVSPRSGTVIETIMVQAGQDLKLDITLDRLVHTEQMVVTAGPEARSEAETYQPVEVLSGTELTEQLQPTLGETLSNQPGVNSTYFGPGASRPIIRGLGGDRIRVLQDGVGSGDASNTSPDHAVSLEPSIAERIEVVRGPATLLYGSSAVGGVVNVLDNRIPDYRTDRPITGSVDLRAGTVSDETAGSLNLNGSIDNFGWHVDLSKRETDDYEIPGFAEEHHDEEEPGHDEEPGHEEEQPFGILPNSFVESDGAGAGISYIGDKGFLGFAYSGFNTLYGVPGHHHHEEEEHAEDEVRAAQEEEEEPVRIDLNQRRYDVRGGYNSAFGFFRALKLRLGVTNYEHAELEGEAVGTLFTNDSFETRVEALHKPFGSFTGSFGLQIANRDFTAVGEEAFLPPTDTSSWALFLYEEMGSGDLRLQLGGRFEHQDVDAETTGINSRSFGGFSASAGVVYLPNEDYSLSAAFARSQKLPNAEELFSNGPHIATNAFEIGDPNLDTETSYGFDVSLRRLTGPVTGEVSFFVNRFNDFIFEQFTDEIEDGLQVFRYVQTDALFIGAEAHADIELIHAEPHHVSLELLGDFVRAEITDTDEALPRIPPFRIGGGINYQGRAFFGNIHLRYVDNQSRVSSFEEPTDSYTMLNANIGYRLFAGGMSHEFILRGTNLTDEEARNHVSFLKEVAPLPGRDISIIYKLMF